MSSPQFSGKLHDAAKRNDPHGIAKHLKPHAENVDDFDEHGMSALHHACAAGAQEAVVFLVSKGADTDLPSRKGKTPIQYAQEKFQAHIVRLLTESYGVSAPTSTFTIAEVEEE